MKKRQTMGKMMRDRELRERRALKQQKKDERKLAANEPELGAEGGEDDGSGEGGETVLEAGERSTLEEVLSPPLPVVPAGEG